MKRDDIYFDGVRRKLESGEFAMDFQLDLFPSQEDDHILQQSLYDGKLVAVTFTVGRQKYDLQTFLTTVKPPHPIICLTPLPNGGIEWPERTTRVCGKICGPIEVTEIEEMMPC